MFRPVEALNPSPMCTSRVRSASISKCEMKCDWPWDSPGMLLIVVCVAAVSPPSLLVKRTTFG